MNLIDILLSKIIFKGWWGGQTEQIFFVCELCFCFIYCFRACQHQTKHRSTNLHPNFVQEIHQQTLHFKLLWTHIWICFFLTDLSTLFLFTNWHCWCYFHHNSQCVVIFNYLNIVSHILHDSPHQTHFVKYHPNISATISLKELHWENEKQGRRHSLYNSDGRLTMHFPLDRDLFFEIITSYHM